MSESYAEFQEADGSVRMAGQLAYPQATPSDVLTVQDDGTIEAAAGGGSMTLFDTQTVTTDPDDFTVLPLVDAGGPCFVYMRATLTAYDADGETVGPVDPTDIYFDMSNFTAGRESNALSTPTFYLTDWRGWDVNTYMSAIGQWIGVTLPTERYTQPWLQVFQNADVYAGANHPTGTFLLESWKLPLTSALPT